MSKKSDYADKLRHPKWQRKRLEVMQKADFKCEICGDDNRELNVHHLEYRDGKDPWDYPDYFFCVLCEICHTIAHDTLDELLEHSRQLILDSSTRVPTQSNGISTEQYAIELRRKVIKFKIQICIYTRNCEGFIYKEYDPDI